MGHMELPPEVRKAKREGNSEALRAMGAKGASRALQNRDFKKAVQKERTHELEIEQAKLLSLSPEGDVLPPDQTVIENLNEK